MTGRSRPEGLRRLLFSDVFGAFSGGPFDGEAFGVFSGTVSRLGSSGRLGRGGVTGDVDAPGDTDVGISAAGSAGPRTGGDSAGCGAARDGRGRAGDGGRRRGREVHRPERRSTVAATRHGH